LPDTINPHEALSIALRISYTNTLHGRPRATTTSRKTNKIDHEHPRHFGRSETAQKTTEALPLKRSLRSERAVRRRQLVQSQKATRWWRLVHNKLSNNSTLKLTRPTRCHRRGIQRVCDIQSKSRAPSTCLIATAVDQKPRDTPEKDA
jgi:hypothetical protein